jgi:hypothetical protein
VEVQAAADARAGARAAAESVLGCCPAQYAQLTTNAHAVYGRWLARLGSEALWDSALEHA